MFRPQLDASEKSSPPDTGFVTTFKKFYEESLPKITEAEITVVGNKTYYIESAKYLGEDDDSLKKKTSEVIYCIDY